MEGDYSSPELMMLHGILKEDEIKFIKNNYITPHSISTFVRSAIKIGKVEEVNRLINAAHNFYLGDANSFIYDLTGIDPRNIIIFIG